MGFVRTEFMVSDDMLSHWMHIKQQHDSGFHILESEEGSEPRVIAPNQKLNFNIKHKYQVWDHVPLRKNLGGAYQTDIWRKCEHIMRSCADGTASTSMLHEFLVCFIETFYQDAQEYFIMCRKRNTHDVMDGKPANIMLHEILKEYKKLECVKNGVEYEEDVLDVSGITKKKITYKELTGASQ